MDQQLLCHHCTEPIDPPQTALMVGFATMGYRHDFIHPACFAAYRSAHEAPRCSNCEQPKTPLYQVSVMPDHPQAPRAELPMCGECVGMLGECVGMLMDALAALTPSPS